MLSGLFLNSKKAGLLIVFTLLVLYSLSFAAIIEVDEIKEVIQSIRAWEKSSGKALP